jgi:hypothetical protein
MPKNWSKWEATRSKGLLRFVLLSGVLGWGVSVAIVYSLVMWAVFPHLQPGPLLARSLIIFPAAGVLWGLAVWFWTERQYVRFKKSTEA